MKAGFDAVFDKNSKVLILGSFPSVLSFKEGFYYGNPRNRFWGLLQEIYCRQLNSIEDKKQLLLDNNIALWDIVFTGQNINNGKESSSDSNLHCEQVADIPWIISNSKIKKIICNGKKSYELFCKYYKDLVDMAICLPSTSPANVRFDKEQWIENLSKI